VKSTLLVIVLVAVALLGTGSTLAFMNDACKSNRHSWCAPTAHTVRHEAKIGPG
jgi:predicted ribosomally synthesized peptide with SipW-like signal peptide